MLRINRHTTKQSVLASLAQLVNDSSIEVVISLESLPSFMETYISFSVFNYQLNNYPKKIYWTSSDPRIMEFLHDSNVEVVPASNPFGENSFKKPNYEPTYIDVYKPYRDEKGNIKLELLPKKIDKQEPKTKKHSSKIQAIYKNLFGKKEEGNYEQKIYKKEYLEDEIKEAEKTTVNNLQEDKPEIEEGRKFILQETNNSQKETKDTILRPDSSITPAGFAVDELLKDQGYQRSSLLGKIEEPKIGDKIEESKDKVKQNLDSWLEKIDSTRKALKELQKTFEIKTENSITDELDSRDYQPSQEPEEEYLPPTKVEKVLQFTVASLSLSLLVFSFINFFPTTVYTIDVVSVTKERTETINIPVEKFRSKEVILNSSAQRKLDTNVVKEVDRVIGDVEVINDSGNAIFFDREGIILINSNGDRYRQVAQNGNPGTFRVPPLGGSVIITIQATEPGEDKTLQIGDELSIFNLRGESLGSRVRAVAGEIIDNQQETDDKVITEENYGSLRAEIQDKFELEKNNQIEKLNLRKIYTNPNWFKEFSTDYVFSDEVGTITEDLSVDARAYLEVYYLDSLALEEVLAAKFVDVRNLEEAKILSSEGSFNNVNNKITLVVNFKYIQKNNFDKKVISQTLTSSEFEQAKRDLQKQYPNIKTIERREAGLPMPGIPSRLEITIEDELVT